MWIADVLVREKRDLRKRVAFSYSPERGKSDEGVAEMPDSKNENSLKIQNKYKC